MSTILKKLAVFNLNQVVIEIPRGTLFLWTPETGKLVLQPGATPEHLSKLAETGQIDQVKSIYIDSRCKKMTSFPVLSQVISDSLEELEVSSPKMEELEDIYKLSGLKKLSLRLGSKVETIPQGIKQLNRLETLEIAGNRLKELPEDFVQLKQLKNLKISDSPITNLPEDLGQLPLASIKLTHLKKLKVLPESLGDTETLQSIELDYVPVKKLPEGIYTLPNLEKIIVQDSKLSSLGTTIQWPKLVELNLYATYKKWPKDFKAPQLKDVYIGGNFTKTPDNLFQKNLDRLVVYAPLDIVDPQWATIRLFEGTCTSAAFAKLSKEEQIAFSSRLRIV